MKTPFVDWSREAVEGGREEILSRNDYLVVDQLRVCDADGRPAVLDLVLFVNGIPLVVIECKSPDARDPLGKAIRDLRAYSGRPLDEDTRQGAGAPRGVPHLFAPAQLLVAADGTRAALGTYSSAEEHYALWRSVTPDYGDPMVPGDDGLEALRRELRGWGLLGAGEQPTLQQRLTAIVLKPGNLVNVVRHYVFEKPVGEDTGGTGSRRARDNDLQRQLRKAVELSGSEVREAASRTDLEKLLRRAGRHGGRAVVFATIQKFLGDLVAGPTEGGDTADGEDRALAEDFEEAQRRVEAGESAEEVADPAPDESTLSRAERIFPECSDSDRVLVLVDEAHRSHTSVLHACLRRALPNAARIGFTGTPLMQGRLTDTGRIFGLEPSSELGGAPEFLDTCVRPRTRLLAAAGQGAAGMPSAECRAGRAGPTCLDGRPPTLSWAVCVPCAAAVEESAAAASAVAAGRTRKGAAVLVDEDDQDQAAVLAGSTRCREHMIVASQQPVVQVWEAPWSFAAAL